MRQRLAPRASRIATSRRRAAAFDSSRFATLAQAISSTAPTTQPRSSGDRAHLLPLVLIAGVERHERQRGSAARSGGGRHGRRSATDDELRLRLFRRDAGLQQPELEQPAVVRVLQQIRIHLAREARRAAAASAPASSSARRCRASRRAAGRESPAASTPTMVKTPAFSRTSLPTMSALPPKRVCHRRWLMTATGCAPGVTSSRRREQAALRGGHAEQIEEVAGDDDAADEVGLAVRVEAGGDAAPRARGRRAGGCRRAAPRRPDTRGCSSCRGR